LNKENVKASTEPKQLNSKIEVQTNGKLYNFLDNFKVPKASVVYNFYT